MSLYSLDFIIDVRSIFMQTFTPVCKEQLTRCRPSFVTVFFLCCRIKLAEKFRTALEARISYRHLLVQVSEGDRPTKDTSEEEIEEWNASAVIIPSVDPGYGT